MTDDEVEVVNDPVSQWVTFRLLNETYGVNVMNVQEVLRGSDIAPVPGAPYYVLGIINLRGNVVPVIDTRIRFGMPVKEMDEASRIIILDAMGQTLGLVVDSVAEVVEVRKSELDSAPSAGSDETSRYILGVISRQSKLLILIDVERFLEDESGGEFDF